jgi:biotin operon repressor
MKTNAVKLGVTLARLGRELELSITAVSKSVARGAQIAQVNGYSLPESCKLTASSFLQ